MMSLRSSFQSTKQEMGDMFAGPFHTSSESHFVLPGHMSFAEGEASRSNVLIDVNPLSRRSTGERKGKKTLSREQSESADAFLVSRNIPTMLSVNPDWHESHGPETGQFRRSRSRKSTASKTEGMAPGASRKEMTKEEGSDAAEEVVKKPCQREAIAMKQLYHWCATVMVLLVVQGTFSSMQHRFQYLPPASDWCASIMLVYSLASALAMYYVARARPFAAYLLGIGSVLMTCLMAWHWQALVAQFRSDVVLQLPATQQLRIATTSTATWVFQQIFGTSAFDFIDTATCLIVLLQNCLQSSFVSRLGIKTATIVSLAQLVILALWPLAYPGMHAAWPCRIGVSVLCAAYFIYCSHAAEVMVKREAQLSAALQTAIQELQDSQHADSMLNHILKNCMADATGCIELFCQTHGSLDGHLSKACDTLFRGISWCKLREAMLGIVSGRYGGKTREVQVQEFAGDFVRGRDVALECPPAVVELDETACNIILDNAVTNAKRHGCAVDPQVELFVDLPDAALYSDSDQPDLRGRAEPAQLRFLVTNRANAERPALEKRWSSAGPEVRLPHDASRPALSDGLGLQHIRQVATACGMAAALWQEDATVYFELLVATPILRLESEAPDPAQSQNPVPPFPPGLHILFLDDSTSAQRSLKVVFEAELPDAFVETSGSTIDEVEDFKWNALAHGDMVILDQHVDVPGHELLGTSIVAELMARGYAGFACIRSGDAEEADVALSLRSGAHWHVGKELPLRRMLQQLRREYHQFVQRGLAPSSAETAMAPDGFASSSSRATQIATGHGPGSVLGHGSGSVFSRRQSAGDPGAQSLGLSKRHQRFPSSSTFAESIVGGDE